MSETWKNEPSFKKWIDPQTGLVCAIYRHPSMGHLCGYVRVPHGKFCNQLRRRNRRLEERGRSMFGHVLHQYAYDHPRLREVSVHGGLTFGGSAALSREPRFKRGFWLGFDCAHAGDLVPQLSSLFTREDRRVFKDTYRDFEYVAQQVQNLAKQVKAINEKVG